MRRSATSLRTRLVLWTVALETVLLLSLAALLVLVLQQLQNQQLAGALTLAASQLNAVTDVVGTRYEIAAADRVPLAAQGLLAWVFTPDGIVAQTVGDAQHLPPPTDLADFGQFQDTTLANGVDVRLLVTPLYEGSRTLGVLALALPLRSSRLFIRQILWSLAVAIPVVVLLSMLGGFFLAGRALAPVSDITTMARTLSAAGLSQRLRLDLPNDEIGRLARTFDEMLMRLEEAFRREQQLTADVAHELRTPLSLLKTQLSLARSRPRDTDTLLAMMASMEADVDRLTRIVEQTLLLTQIEQQGIPTSGAVDLAAVLTAVVGRLQAAAGAITLSLEVPAQAAQTSGQIQGDASLLEQVFTNLVQNAVAYTPAGGSVQVKMRRQGQTAVVTVADTGPGIGPEHLPHLFDRYYRVDSARTRSSGGFGLGLAIVQTIVQAHGGSVTVNSSMGTGTTFTIILPLNAAVVSNQQQGTV